LRTREPAYRGCNKTDHYHQRVTVRIRGKLHSSLPVQSIQRLIGTYDRQLGNLCVGLQIKQGYDHLPSIPHMRPTSLPMGGEAEGLLGIEGEALDLQLLGRGAKAMISDRSTNGAHVCHHRLCPPRFRYRTVTVSSADQVYPSLHARIISRNAPCRNTIPGEDEC